MLLIQIRKILKIKFTLGTHPLPSPGNVKFTDSVIKRAKELNLTKKDLIIVVICGGGSAMFVHPSKVGLEKRYKSKGHC